MTEYKTDYDALCRNMTSLSEGVHWPITVLANAAALLYENMAAVNWAGFYLIRDGKLLLGPFQGKPACMEIAVGKGVCGTAAACGRTQVVPDVHLFPGHIACDGASRSEIVVPIFRDNILYGVLDIDSPLKNRFGPEDRAGLEAFTRVLQRFL